MDLCQEFCLINSKPQTICRNQTKPNLFVGFDARIYSAAIS